MYQALYRKWRPRTFQEVVGQQHITETLRRQVMTDRLSHAYLFTGTRGTGKTTCAKILAKAVNCVEPVDGSPCNQCPACLGIEDGSILDVVELDAASNNGVDQVRALRDEAVYAPAGVKKRVYIIDEVHMLSTAAFNALLKILEEPPEHLMFILATTEAYKVPATIKSRCQQFAFRRLLTEEISGRLKEISAAERIPLSDDAALLLARLADGSMRDGVSLLDQCSGYAETVDVPGVLAALGMAGNLETADMLEAVARGDIARALETLDGLYAAGKELRSLLGELSDLVRDLLIRQVAPDGGSALLSGVYGEDTLDRLGPLLPKGRLIQMQRVLHDSMADLGRAGSPRTDAELCLIRLSDPSLDESTSGLSARLEQLEQNRASAPPGLTPESPQKNTSAPAEKPAEPAGQQEEGPAAEHRDEKPAAEPEHPVPGSATPPQGEKEEPDSGCTVPEFWPALVRDMQGQIPMSLYNTCFVNPSFLQCRLRNNVLELWTTENFYRDALDKPEILTPLTERAAQLAGCALRVTVNLGTAPAVDTVPRQLSGDDPLSSLINLGEQMDNFTII